MNGAVPQCAMVLAAGRGERMRPQTDATPKPLVKVAGKALIDHVLDRLAGACVERAVVNLWYKADMIVAHLADRRRPAIALSREDALLDTGGGVAKALPMLGPEPFFVVSSDGLWRDRGRPALHRLAAVWNDAAMDALLLLQPLDEAVCFDGAGDFFIAGDGRLRRRGEAPAAPHAYTSIQIMHPRAFAGFGGGAYSNNAVWDRALAAGRLHGLVHDGGWCHVGRTGDIERAERWLVEAGG